MATTSSLIKDEARTAKKAYEDAMQPVRAMRKGVVPWNMEAYERIMAAADQLWLEWLRWRTELERRGLTLH